MLMVYETLLIIGALGMLAQAALGLGHGFGGNHGPAAHGHAGPAGHNAGHAHPAGPGHGQRSEGPSPLWALLSPLAIFSLCVGAGATGLLTHAWLHGFWSGLAATAGALLFYGLLIRPVWNFAMRFASEPSKALEGVVAETAEAMSRFDARGQGMVRVTIDGQIVRLLANLEPDDRNADAAVAPGEKLLVTSVDGHTNTCRVTRL
jgi:hypothetical protein